MHPFKKCFSVNILRCTGRKRTKKKFAALIVCKQHTEPAFYVVVQKITKNFVRICPSRMRKKQQKVVSCMTQHAWWKEWPKHRRPKKKIIKLMQFLNNNKSKHN